MELSITELVVLGLLAEGPSHGFAISKELSADGELGQVLTVRRSVVYRALDRLVDAGLAHPLHSEPGRGGPQRVVHGLTRRGRTALERWLPQPVGHVRELRIEFLLKLVLLDRAGKSSKGLVSAQLRQLRETFAALEHEPPGGPVELWRRHNSEAARRFLQDLAR